MLCIFPSVSLRLAVPPNIIGENRVMIDTEGWSLSHCVSDDWKDSHDSQCRTIHLSITVEERVWASWHIAQWEFSWHNCFVPFWAMPWSHCIILSSWRLLEFWILNSFTAVTDLLIGVKVSTKTYLLQVKWKQEGRHLLYCLLLTGRHLLYVLLGAPPRFMGK